MNCEHVEKMMGDLVCGHLPQQQAEEVAKHLVLCASCAGFHRRVSFLYLVDAPSDVAAPGITASPPATRRSLPARWAPRVAAAAVLLAVGYAAAKWIDPAPVQRQDGLISVASLPPIRVNVPDLPKVGPPGDWIDSREDALLLANFSGKPLLERFDTSACSRCAVMRDVLESSSVKRLLGSFVCFRAEVGKKVPAEIVGLQEAEELPHMLPAMRIADECCATDFRWMVGSEADLQNLIESYQGMCDKRRPLGDDLFQLTLEQVRSIPRLLAESRYAEAVEILDRITKLKECYRTCFPEVADDLREQIIAGLEGALEEIRTLYDQGDSSRADAIRLARQLRSQVDGLEFAKRVDAWIE